MTLLAHGIDFGTSNSAIASVHLESGEIVFSSSRAANNSNEGFNQYLVPSNFYFDRSRQRLVGWPGLNQFATLASAKTKCSDCDRSKFRINGDIDWNRLCNYASKREGCFDSRLAHAVKTELASEKLINTHSWGDNYSSIDFVAGVMSELVADSNRAHGLKSGSVKKVVLGYPIVFPGAEGEDSSILERNAIEILKEAATKVGFREIAFLDEGSASNYGMNIRSGRCISLDFGAGTFDVATALKEIDDKTTVLSSHGADIGGNKIDEMLFELFLSQRMGLGSRIKKIPPLYVSQRTANLLMNLRNYTRALHLPDVLSEIQIASTKPGGEPLMEAASLLSSGQGILVYQAIQKAKIELSKNFRSEIKYQLPGLAPISVPIDREALDGVVNSVLPLVEKAIGQSLLDSNWEYSEVDFVLMTGGSSQLQRFRERMNELFPNAKFVDSDPFLTVVRGLGLRARELWM